LRVGIAGQNAAHVAALFGREAAHRDGVGMRHRVLFVDLRAGHAGGGQVLLHALHVAVRGCVDRLFHVHLIDQVNAALQIQPKVNALEQSVLQGRAADAMRNAEDPVDEDHQDRDDECCLAFQILTHDSCRKAFPRPRTFTPLRNLMRSLRR